MSAQTSAFRCFVSTRYQVLSLISVCDVVGLALVCTGFATHVFQWVSTIVEAQLLLLPGPH